jgi:hypothetical protein
VYKHLFTTFLNVLELSQHVRCAVRTDLCFVDKYEDLRDSHRSSFREDGLFARVNGLESKQCQVVKKKFVYAGVNKFLKKGSEFPQNSRR